MPEVKPNPLLEEYKELTRAEAVIDSIQSKKLLRMGRAVVMDEALYAEIKAALIAFRQYLIQEIGLRQHLIGVRAVLERQLQEANERIAELEALLNPTDQAAADTTTD